MGVSLGLMFFQQFSGINAVMFYSVSFADSDNIVTNNNSSNNNKTKCKYII
jgi:hypothetical protein